jgi:hypothetical protein
MIEYPVSVTFLDFYKKEAIENCLNNLILMDRHYFNFNRKFVNARKERVNDIMKRIAVLTAKFKVLENVNKAIRISASKAFPFKKERQEYISVHYDEEFDPRDEETLDPVYNKIFGRRLLHEVGELGNRVETSMQDLNRLVNTYKDFNMERDIIGEMAKSKRQENEAVLGRVPHGVKNVSELLLFDSATNVYNDVNVQLSDLKLEKPLTKKQRKKMEREKARRKRLEAQMKMKKETGESIQAAPGSVSNRNRDHKFRGDDLGLGFTPGAKAAPAPSFAANLDSLGENVVDFLNDEEMIGGEGANIRTVNWNQEDHIAPSKVKEEIKKEKLNESQATATTNSRQNRYVQQITEEGNNVVLKPAPIDFMLQNKKDGYGNDGDVLGELNENQPSNPETEVPLANQQPAQQPAEQPGGPPPPPAPPGQAQASTGPPAPPAPPGANPPSQPAGAPAGAPPPPPPPGGVASASTGNAPPPPPAPPSGAGGPPPPPPPPPPPKAGGKAPKFTGHVKKTA